MGGKHSGKRWTVRRLKPSWGAGWEGETLPLGPEAVKAAEWAGSGHPPKGETEAA